MGTTVIKISCGVDWGAGAGDGAGGGVVLARKTKDVRDGATAAGVDGAATADDAGVGFGAEAGRRVTRFAGVVLVLVGVGFTNTWSTLVFGVTSQPYQGTRFVAATAFSGRFRGGGGRKLRGWRVGNNFWGSVQAGLKRCQRNPDGGT